MDLKDDGGQGAAPAQLGLGAGPPTWPSRVGAPCRRFLRSNRKSAGQAVQAALLRTARAAAAPTTHLVRRVPIHRGLRLPSLALRRLYSTLSHGGRGGSP